MQLLTYITHKSNDFKYLVKHQIKENLISNRYTYDRLRPYRFTDQTYQLRIDKKYALKQLGKKLTHSINTDDQDDALYVFNKARNNSLLNFCTMDYTKFFYDHFRIDVFNCNDCENIYLYDVSHNVCDDYQVCEHCIRNYYWSEYNQYYASEPDENDDYNDNEDMGIILGRHENKDIVGHIPSKFDKRKTRVLLGLELEIECNSDHSRSDRASAINDAIGNLTINDENYQYCGFEEDCSLNNGFEIVTGYTGLDVHSKQLQFFKQSLSGLKSHDTSTCGLHIHVCKSDMSTFHASKLILFINDDDNFKLINAIARRESSQYSAIKNKKDDKSWLKDAMKYDRKSSQLRNLNYSRYEALNFQNENTIEFRLFKGTLKYQTIMACLEFSYASWFFARESSSKELNTDNFLKFISRSDNLSDTRNLRTYLLNKGFTIPSHKLKNNTSQLITI